MFMPHTETYLWHLENSPGVKDVRESCHTMLTGTKPLPYRTIRVRTIITWMKLRRFMDDLPTIPPGWSVPHVEGMPQSCRGRWSD